MDPERVVLDTNVAISGLLWDGPPNNIIVMVRRKIVDACVSPALFKELQKVLAYKHIALRLSTLQFTAEEAFLQYASIVTPVNSREIPPITACGHAPDNDVLWTAIVATSSLIISGDKHLSRMKRFRNIDIVNPSDFIKTHIPHHG